MFVCNLYKLQIELCLTQHASPNVPVKSCSTFPYPPPSLSSVFLCTSCVPTSFLISLCLSSLSCLNLPLSAWFFLSYHFPWPHSRDICRTAFLIPLTRLLSFLVPGHDIFYPNKFTCYFLKYKQTSSPISKPPTQTRQKMRGKMCFWMWWFFMVVSLCTLF